MPHLFLLIHLLIFAILADNSFQLSDPPPHLETMEIEITSDKINVSGNYSLSKKSLKRRADKKVPDSSTNKMQAPSLPSDSVSSNLSIK